MPVEVITLDDEVTYIQVLEQGPPGPPGPQGDMGLTGQAGNTVLYGTIDPVTGIGVDGNFYINTTTSYFFGPKLNGKWPAGVSMIGAPGPPGVQGPQGKTIIYGATDPTAGVGSDGDSYINTTTHFLFGPKAAGAWPAGTSLVGPQGPQGVPGLSGAATVIVSPTPPVGVVDNTFWWNSTNGQLYVRYNDGNSTAWVIAAPQPDVAAYLMKTGDAMLGQLLLAADPTAPLGAATKAYVDAHGGVGGTPDLSGLVQKSGDTMTGNLKINKAGPGLLLDRTDATSDAINLQRAGKNRWALQGGINAESSGNVGSDFYLYRFNDAGVVIDAPLSIERATGRVGMPSMPLFIPHGFVDVGGSNSLQLWVDTAPPFGLAWRYNEAGSYRTCWDNTNNPGGLTTSGYQKFKSGLVLQWGYQSGNGADYWMNFPIQFPSYVYYAAAMARNSVSYGQTLTSVMRDDVTTASVVFQMRSITAGAVTGHATSFFWFALGV
jgi:hypothetical protein